MTAPDRSGTPDLVRVREQIIARLAAAFGPHKAAVSRPADEDHRHPWTEFVPSGNDERGSTLIVFPDTDGQNSMRALTYGEIADALCEPADEDEQFADVATQGLHAPRADSQADL